MLRMSLLITLGLTTACFQKDADDDGIPDEEDAFPDDADETEDSDGDGVGDNADVFPDDADETEDTDEDGVGDNADAFPDDATETVDTDEDGVGDNADTFPDDADETVDTDEDGVGDNADAFPDDALDSVDTDGDGLGDNAEVDAGTDPNESDSDGDGLSDGEEIDTYSTDPLSTDSDGDGLSDGDEVDYGTDPTIAPTLSGTGIHDVIFVDTANNCSYTVSYTTIATDPSLPTCAECEYVWTLEQSWVSNGCGGEWAALDSVSVGFDLVNSTGTSEIYFYNSDDAVWFTSCYNASGVAYTNTTCNFTGDIAGGTFDYSPTFDYSGYAFNGFEIDSIVQTIELSF